ncbi:MAG TPA: biotin/lipoyl-binding protein, partial [Noviherbaspirillum sp.]
MVTGKKAVLASGVVTLLAVAAGFAFRFLHLPGPDQSSSRTLILSGNIEAHESVLGFKTVQSRIVQLPFNEGQWVTKGTTLAVVDDTDYRQQVSLAEANEAIQQR